MQRVDRVRSSNTGGKYKLQLQNIEFSQGLSKTQTKEGAADGKRDQSADIILWVDAQQSKLVCGWETRGEEQSEASCRRCS